MKSILTASNGGGGGIAIPLRSIAARFGAASTSLRSVVKPPPGVLIPPPKKTTCASTSRMKLAEGEGFEPPVPCGTPVFKTGSFNHSDTPPKRELHYRGWSRMVSSRHFDNFAAKVHNGRK